MPLPIPVKIVIKDVHRMTLSICGFRENPRRDVFAFVIGVGELYSYLNYET
jgi:hypothetical protein